MGDLADGWFALRPVGNFACNPLPAPPYGARVKRLGFRGRLFVILLLFALVPVVLLTLAWGATIRWAIPLVGATGAVEQLAATGAPALAAARAAGTLTPQQRAAVDAHDRALRESRLRARQVAYLAGRAPTAALVLAIAMALVFGVVASRVAGHLSRMLGRPLAELVVWAERIGRGEPLPEGRRLRGAPEFELLRQQMRTMAQALDVGRAQALEAQRLAAFRETARQVAHELKNPLTPIRFAVARLRRHATPELRDDVEVLAIEAERLERMARSFAAFGRLPEGPVALVDIGELVRYTARATVPDAAALTLEVEEQPLMVAGHHDALAGAVSNVLINAVEACREGGTVTASVARKSTAGGRDEIVIAVADTGCGMSRAHLERIWEPYVTGKAGGTGLGLAIVRQTIVAHGGSVSAASEPGAGTTIRLALPAAPATSGAGITAVSSA